MSPVVQTSLGKVLAQELSICLIMHLQEVLGLLLNGLIEKAMEGSNQVDSLQFHGFWFRSDKTNQFWSKSRFILSI